MESQLLLSSIFGTIFSIILLMNSFKIRRKMLVLMTDHDGLRWNPNETVVFSALLMIVFLSLTFIGLVF